MKLNYRIVITGGTGRFGSILQKKYKSKKLWYPNKNELNILSIRSIETYLKKIKPKILIHAAGLSRPMYMHDDNISKSIDLNIIGTANIVKICSRLKIKLIYLSTNYVYEGKHGNYKEIDPVHPVNNYAWSKLGGESSVQMYKNSLILRLSMTERFFAHKKAYSNVRSNFIYNDEVADIIFKIINYKGIINIGGKTQTIYKFAKKYNFKIKKIFFKKKDNTIPINSSTNISKLKLLLKKD
jgi:dTDP-4-dehydrorhamnose reductase